MAKKTKQRKLRRPISKRTRFEVFKRDSFTCQYCGESAPRVVRHLDHIEPVSQDGAEDILNYVTACEDCNLGKGARRLKDNSSVERQKRHLDKLAAKREQLKMLLEWRENIKKIEDEEIEAVELEMRYIAKGDLTDYGRRQIGKWIKKYGLANLLDSVQAANQQHRPWGEEEEYLELVRRIASIKKLSEAEPDLPQLLYIRGILRNRLNRCFSEYKALELMRDAISDGKSADEIKRAALSCRSWTQFREDISPDESE